MENYVTPFWHCSRKQVWMKQHNQIKPQECMSRGWYRRSCVICVGLCKHQQGSPLKAEAMFPEIDRYKRPSQGNCVEDCFPQQQNLIYCHHDWLPFLSPRMLQRSHGPGHHPLLLWRILSAWSLPAQHLSAQDQSPSAHLLWHLPPTLLCAWFLCVILLAAQQGLPCPRSDRDLCFHLCPILWV